MLLIELKQRLADIDATHDHDEVIIRGCYASDGAVIQIDCDSYEGEVTIQSDICSG